MNPDPACAAGPLVVACGPRPGGNTAWAANRIRDALAAQGLSPVLARLADFDVLPCTGCQACAHTPGHACVLAGQDQAEELFAAIEQASGLFFVSPIYFYHLPALFKALIDRSQRFFAARQAGDLSHVGPQGRQAHVCLVAGRPRGAKLFEGSLLTLRYFLWPFGIALAEPLTLMGLDGPGDLAADTEAVPRLDDWTANAARA
ncbi:flavodoxin family protein [Fundidesulfovibrio butyratiphilus]